MKAPIRTTILAACIGAALAPAALTARADSATGNDTVIGNSRNPGYPGGPRAVDPDWDMDDRSPTGLLYEPPRPIPERSRTATGWDYTGWVELGGYGGDADSRAALYRMYKDMKRGAALESFGLQAENAAQARYVEAWGGAAGQDDQFYALQFGRYNDWKVKAFFNGTPHTYTTSYRSLWDGVGSGTLTLSNPTLLPPGGPGRTAAQVTGNINTFLATAGDSDLSVVRKEGGARLELRMSESWRAFAGFSTEKREGARPFGAVWGGGGGGNNLEVAEPVDYTTHEIMGGVQFADSLHSFNAQVAASFFRNNIDTLLFQSPMPVAPAAGTTGLAAGSFTAGRFDLMPDNDYYNLKAEYARALPALWNGRITALASWASSRQDDALKPSMDAPGLVVNGVAGGQWNTTNSLSRTSAGARFDSRLVDLGLALNPASGLDVKLRARHNATDNKTEYWACNPLTGQWGRVINDGSGLAIVSNFAGTPPWPTGAQYCNLQTLLANTAANGNVPSAGNAAIRNIPWDYKQTQWTANADYRLGARSSVNASYEREVMRRDNRERERTWEDKFKVGYVNRVVGAGTLRLSQGFERRRGTEYVGDVYEQFVSGSLGGLPATGNGSSWVHVLASFRKYDLADRDQAVTNARFNYPLLDTLDGAVSAHYRDIDYPDSAHGRDSHRIGSLNLELTYQPTPKLSAFGFLGLQSGRMAQRSIWPLACTLGTAGVTAANFEELCPQPGSPLYPLNRNWSVDSKDRNHTGGAGIRYDFGRAIADLSFTRASGRTEIGYEYDPVGLANNITAAQRALAGSGMPDLITRQTFVDANVLVPVSKRVSLRVVYRHERGSVRDWHYDGVAATPTAGGVVYLDSGPQDYKVNVFGLFVRISL